MRFLRPLARMWTALIGVVALALVLGVAARLIAPLTPWAVAPALAAADPSDGASGVRPRAAITLRFSAPMNRASAEAALRIDPPTAGTVSWSPDATALTFQPDAPLASAMTYTIRLDGAALGRWWRPLVPEATVSFRTAPQPAVVAALPEVAGAPVDTPLAVIFSQPMVPPEAVGAPAALPALRLAPATPFGARWADQRTLVVYPAAPLAPATRYTVTLDAGLTDLLGVELGQPFSWSFTTGWPAVIARAPEHEARWVSPRAPLTLRLAAPVDLGLLRQALRITPPVQGDLAAEVIGATQVVTFTPRGGWAYGTTYAVALDEPTGSDLGPPPTLPWQFSVEPAPRLVAFFPGQGQVLPPGEAIRLVFSTPMDETALRAGLRIEPPVAELPISVSETEVRLRPDLAPSTLYTLTLAADTRDRSGEPLGAEAVVRLRTAPARPALAAPDAVAGVLSLPPALPAEVALATTNLTVLDLSLYPLDQATMLRALALRPDEWPAFSPERYGQALARARQVTPTAPLDEPRRLMVPVGLADGDPLPPGTYYLRATSPEGPRADLILLVGDARLTLRHSPGYALVWATDTAGAPLASQAVALYAGEALLGRGQTGPDGVWALPIAHGDGPPLLAVTEGGPPALARSDWLIAAPAPTEPAIRALLFPGQARYAPGERAEVRGLARRRAADGTLALPVAETLCRLQLRAEGRTVIGPSGSCQVEAATGAISGALALPPQLAAGDYNLVAQIGDASVVVAIAVAPPQAPRFALAAAPASADALLLRVSRGGLPLAGAVVSWTLRLEPLAPPAPPAGFAQGPTEALPQTLSGQAAADADGQVRVTLPPSVAASAYRLRASLPGDDSGVASAEGLRSPGPTLVAVGLPSRVLPSDQRSTVRLLARDGLGQPVAGARVRVEVFRAGGRGAPVLARQAVSGPDGAATVELVQLRPGEYEVVASAGGPGTATPLWVYGGRFSGWSAVSGELRLVPDRDRYSPGDVASLLVAAPTTTGTLLLTVERGSLLSAEVRELRAGQIIRLPITAEMAPGVSVGGVLFEGGTRRVGSVALAITGQPADLAAQLAVPLADAAPGASAPVTVTTTLGGAPTTADLLIAIAPADSPSDDLALARLASGPPPASAVAGLPPTLELGAAGPVAPSLGPRGFAPPFTAAAGAPGLATGALQLPDIEGRWRLTAYAVGGPGLVAAASALVTTSLPLAYDLLAPPALRTGDRAEVSLLLRNGGPVARELTVTLAVDGLDLDPPRPAAVGEAGAQRLHLSLGPGESGVPRWSVAAVPGAQTASLDLTIEAPDLRESLTRGLELLATGPATLAGETLVGLGPLATSLDLAARPGDTLQIAVAPGLRAALADQATALAALAAPSVEERAALALIATGLARGVPGDEGEHWARAATTALDALTAAQNEDGGWGWWPGAPSRPFTTAFALEAQAAARAVLRATQPPSLRAIAYLARTAPDADAATRAYVAYALARAGRSEQGAAELAGAEPGPDGLAYLAMTLPAAQAAPLLDRLQATAERAPATPGAFAPITWTSPDPAGLPRGEAAVTAAVAQALRARRPTAPELPGAETALLRTWSVAGWPTAFDAARVAAALLDDAPAAGNGPARVTVDDTVVLGSGAPFTTVRRAGVPVGDLPERATIAVETRGPAAYLVAYGLPAPGPQAAPRLSLLSELVDPTGGAPLDPATLRAGQLVGLRLTAVVARPVVRADLELPLPAGLAFVAATPRGPFQHVADTGRGLVRVGGADLQPGVYTQLVIARAVAPGSFGAPPARITLPHEPGQVAVAPAGLLLTIGE